MRRRDFVGSLGALSVIALGRSRTAAGNVESLGRKADDAARSGALKAMRFMNTVLAIHKAKTGKYPGPADLAQSPALQDFADHPLAAALKAGRFENLVLHFRTTLAVTNNGLGYQLRLTEDSGLFAYASDETGRIKEVVREKSDGPEAVQPLKDPSKR